MESRRRFRTGETNWSAEIRDCRIVSRLDCGHDRSPDCAEKHRPRSGLPTTKCVARSPTEPPYRVVHPWLSSTPTRVGGKSQTSRHLHSHRRQTTTVDG